LPSFNIQFLPTPQVHVRFAASRGVTLPSFSNATASGSYGVSTPSGFQGTVNLADPANFDPTSAGYNPWWLSGTMGNPELKPQISDNFDLSYEWYMPHNGMFHAGLFYKTIHDYIGSQRVAANIPPIYLGNGVTIGGAGAGEISRASNLGDATVQGAEIGFTKFFDFLPGPFSGLGIDTNFTYIDSSAPGDQSYDMLGQPVHGLPINGLSRNVYNATLMYEKGPLSMRLAWNWRSKYLLTAESANGTSGQYSYAGCKAVPFNQAQGSCNYDPPVFSADYGQLDFGATYRFNQHVSLSIEGQNMLHAVTRTLQGAGAQQFPYSYFISDSRINGSIRFNF
jgi:TonB-dependent receptor